MTDDRAFLDATLPHLDTVWNVARRLAGGHVEAPDLVQETYLRAFRGFAAQGRGEMRAWLVAICVNVARSERRKLRSRPLQTADDGLCELADLREDVCARALSAVERDVVADAIGRLPEAQREAIVLCDLAGLTAREAAELLDVPRGTLLARVHRGRRQLGQLLDEGAVDRVR